VEVAVGVAVDVFVGVAVAEGVLVGVSVEEGVEVGVAVNTIGLKPKSRPTNAPHSNRLTATMFGVAA
jgi:hypothetical protein